MEIDSRILTRGNLGGEMDVLSVYRIFDEAIKFVVD